VMQNHHLTSVSTSPEKTEQQFFYSAEPISASILPSEATHTNASEYVCT